MAAMQLKFSTEPINTVQIVFHNERDGGEDVTPGISPMDAMLLSDRLMKWARSVLPGADYFLFRLKDDPDAELLLDILKGLTIEEKARLLAKINILQEKLDEEAKG